MAGVAHNPKHIKDIEPITAKFKTALANGRLGFYEVGIGKGEQVRIVNVYCWTGAHNNQHARKRTANMFIIIKAELDAPSECPTFMMGDFNGDIDDFPTLTKLIDEEGWSDLGAIAD